MCSGSEQRACIRPGGVAGCAPVHRVPADIDGIVATKATRLGISLGNPNPNPRECLDYAKSIVLEPRRHVRAPLLCPLRGEGER